jgi:hypothetical protein
MRHSVSTHVAFSNQYKLTAWLAEKECAARRIVKKEIQGEDEVGQFTEEGLDDEGGIGQPNECEGGPVDGGNDKDKDSDDDDEGEDSDEDSDEGRKDSSTAVFGGETYAQRRERNIVENRRLLDEVKAKYPIREEKKVENERCVNVLKS